MRIAVDAMGGDHAPLEIIKGAIAAVERVPELEILLVGRSEQIRDLAGGDFKTSRIKIIHADEIIAATGLPPAEVLSILITLELKGIIEQHPGKYFSLKK